MNLTVNLMLNSAIWIPFFLYDGICKFDCKGRYLEALYETRCGYYKREEEIKNDTLFKTRVKQKFMEIKEYSEMEVWISNTSRRYIYDDDSNDDGYDNNTQECTGVWKESEEEKKQRIELLLFLK